MKIEKSIYAWPKNIQGEAIQTLIQFIDINDALHFELIWTGEEWIDCPGELFEQALVRGMPGAENWTTAPKESFVDLFFPGALEPRFNAEQQKEIKKFLKLDIEDRVLEIATHIHAEQLDLANRPLINHVLRTMENATMMPSVEQMPLEDKINLYLGAVLHKTLDHPGSSLWPKVLPSDLAEWGVPRDALAIVESLTKNYSLAKYLGQDRDQASYLADVAANPLARLVKIGQVTDDANSQRILWMRRMRVALNPSSNDLAETIEAMNLSDVEFEQLARIANSPIESLSEEPLDKSEEEWLSEFRTKLEQVLVSFSKGDPDEVAIDIELLYLDYKPFGDHGYSASNSFRDSFNEFLLASCKYLYSIRREDVVKSILRHINPLYFDFGYAGQEVSVAGQLGNIKLQYSGPKHPIDPPRWIEEDFPEINEEKKQ